MRLSWYPRQNCEHINICPLRWMTVMNNGCELCLYTKISQSQQRYFTYRSLEGVAGVLSLREGEKLNYDSFLVQGTLTNIISALQQKEKKTHSKVLNVAPLIMSAFSRACRNSAYCKPFQRCIRLLFRCCRWTAAVWEALRGVCVQVFELCEYLWRRT